MEYPLALQLQQLLVSLAAGMGLGLLYDVLRALRRNSGRRTVRALLDILFVLLAALALFTLGMGPGNGSLMVFMVFFALAGFGLYMAFASPLILKVLLFITEAFKGLLAFVLSPFRILLNKIENISENIFTNGKKWFTITANHLVVMSISHAKRKTGSGPNEVQKSEPYHKDSYCGPDSLRNSEHDFRQGQDRPGAGRKSGA